MLLTNYACILGEQYIIGQLRARGIQIQRARYRSLKPDFKKHLPHRIVRTKYRTRAALSKVHLDTNHHIIRLLCTKNILSLFHIIIDLLRAYWPFLDFN